MFVLVEFCSITVFSFLVSWFWEVFQETWFNKSLFKADKTWKSHFLSDGAVGKYSFNNVSICFQYLSAKALSDIFHFKALNSELHAFHSVEVVYFWAFSHTYNPSI